MSEYKKFDTQDTFTIHNARVAKDVKVFEGDRGKSVQVTFVCTSRQEADKDIWLTAKIADRDADLASYLQKGDVLGFSGKLANKPWGDSEPQKDSFELRFASMYASVDLFMKLKERGFTPSAKGGEKAPPPKKAAVPPKRPAPQRRPIVDIPDEE